MSHISITTISVSNLQNTDEILIFPSNEPLFFASMKFYKKNVYACCKGNKRLTSIKSVLSKHAHNTHIYAYNFFAFPFLSWLLSCGSRLQFTSWELNLCEIYKKCNHNVKKQRLHKLFDDDENRMTRKGSQKV